MGKILGICISEKRGTEKHEIQEANLVKVGESRESSRRQMAQAGESAVL